MGRITGVLPRDATMQFHRLRWLLLFTIPLYTLWMCFVLSVGHVVNPLALSANVVLGLLVGGIAVFLADHTAPRLYWRDGLLNIIFYGMLAALFAAFSLRGNFSTYGTANFFTDQITVNPGGMAGYLSQFAWRGGVLGLLLWLLAGSGAGAVRGGNIGGAITATVTLLGLFTAPIVANLLFNGALFVIVAVGVRLLVSLLVDAMSDWWQGFCFGALAGLLLIALPFVGFYGYGVL